MQFKYLKKFGRKFKNNYLANLDIFFWFSAFSNIIAILQQINVINDPSSIHPALGYKLTSHNWTRALAQIRHISAYATLVFKQSDLKRIIKLKNERCFYLHFLIWLDHGLLSMSPKCFCISCCHMKILKARTCSRSAFELHFHWAGQKFEREQ